MAKAKKFTKVERVNEVAITERVKLVLFESGTIQLRNASDWGISCTLSDQMIEAIMTVKFKHELDKMRIDAMDLKAAKGTRSPKVSAAPIVKPVDIQAMIRAEIQAAISGMAKQA